MQTSLRSEKIEISNPLGLPAIEGLKLVTRMDNISDYNS